MKVEKRIVVNRETKEFIQRAFNCSERTVRRALHYEATANGNLGERIRRLALQRDGYIIRSIKEMETIHDSDGVMRQYFGNGAILEFDKRTGMGYLRHKGEVIKSYPHVQISQIAQIQTEAASL